MQASYFIGNSLRYRYNDKMLFQAHNITRKSTVPLSVPHLCRRVSCSEFLTREPTETLWLTGLVGPGRFVMKKAAHGRLNNTQ